MKKIILLILVIVGLNAQTIVQRECTKSSLGGFVPARCTDTVVYTDSNGTDSNTTLEW